LENNFPINEALSFGVSAGGGVITGVVFATGRVVDGNGVVFATGRVVDGNGVVFATGRVVDGNGVVFATGSTIPTGLTVVMVEVDGDVLAFSARYNMMSVIVAVGVVVYAAKSGTFFGPHIFTTVPLASVNLTSVPTGTLIEDTIPPLKFKSVTLNGEYVGAIHLSTAVEPV
jgi:hypothetical protein